MAITRLESTQWQSYFDHMAHLLDGKRAEIEIDALPIGSQIEAEWLPLIGITYDPKNALVDVALEGLDHLIRNPRDILLDQSATELHSMEVIDSDEVHHIIRLRDPLMLSAPSH